MAQVKDILGGNVSGRLEKIVDGLPVKVGFLDRELPEKEIREGDEVEFDEVANPFGGEPMATNLRKVT